MIITATKYGISLRGTTYHVKNTFWRIMGFVVLNTITLNNKNCWLSRLFYKESEV